MPIKRISSNENNIKGGLRFKCDKCGKCCSKKIGFTTLIYPDIQRISSNFDLTPSEFVEKYCLIFERRFKTPTQEKVVLREICLEHQDHGCPFLKNNKCSIHKIKPFICKSYPYLQSMQYIVKLRKKLVFCGGHGQGDLLPYDEVQRLIDINNAEYLKGVLPFKKFSYDFNKMLGISKVKTIVCELDVGEYEVIK